jgi:hypothetical protein
LALVLARRRTPRGAKSPGRGWPGGSPCDRRPSSASPGTAIRPNAAAIPTSRRSSRRARGRALVGGEAVIDHDLPFRHAPPRQPRTWSMSRCGAPAWNSPGVHPSQPAVAFVEQVLLSRTRAQASSTGWGGIHNSGIRPSINRLRSRCASVRSVLARCLGPRRAAVSAGSATCAVISARARRRRVNTEQVSTTEN